MNAEKTGKYIAELRKEKQLTQAQLADILNVSYKTVSKWETGRGFPDIAVLESLAAALDTGIADLIRGEQLPRQTDTDEVNRIMSEGTALFSNMLAGKVFRYLSAGFLAGLVILSLAVMHVISPQYIQDPGENILQVQALEDGRLVALMEQEISGWDTYTITSADTGRKETFITCYTTALDRFRHRSAPQAVLLGSPEETGNIYYYPGGGWDRLLYSVWPDTSEGVETLPRLTYNMWLALCLALSVLMLTVWYFLRRKYYGSHLLKAAMVPVCLSLANILVLFGKRMQIYNAAYYLSGILLCAFCMYLLFLALISFPKAR